MKTGISLVKQKKIKRDLIKISNFYEKILDNLYKKLNLIHKKNFSKRYWEILIWVWLYNLLFIILIDGKL